MNKKNNFTDTKRRDEHRMSETTSSSVTQSYSQIVDENKIQEEIDHLKAILKKKKKKKKIQNLWIRV